MVPSSVVRKAVRNWDEGWKESSERLETLEPGDDIEIEMQTEEENARDFPESHPSSQYDSFSDHNRSDALLDDEFNQDDGEISDLASFTVL